MRRVFTPILWAVMTLAAAEALAAANHQAIVNPGLLADAWWHDYAIPVRWMVNDQGVIDNYNNGNTTTVTLSEVVSDLTAAFQTWADVSTSRADATYYGASAETDVGLDGINLLTWADSYGFGPTDNSYAVALLFMIESPTTVGPGNRDINNDGTIDLAPSIYPDGTYLRPGTIIDANIKFNPGYYDWTTTPDTPPRIAWIRSIATHEIGHVFGLTHSPYLCPAPTMYAYTDSGSIAAQQNQLTLERDDIAGISRYYPETGQQGSYGKFTGRLMLSPSEGAGGCAVAAINRVTGKTTVSSITYGLWMADGQQPGSFTLDWLPAGCYVVTIDYFDGGERRWGSAYNYDVWWSNVCDGTTAPLGFAPHGELYKINNTANDDLPRCAVLNVGAGQTVNLETAYVNKLQPTAPAGATQLTLTDDGYAQVNFTDGFLFPFYGTQYGSVFVGSNGYITFGQGDSDPSPTVAEFTGPLPRIAALWRDLNPAAGGITGGVYVKQDSARCDIIFQGVPAKTSGRACTFTITLYRYGTIRFRYQYLGASAGLVGITPGNSATLQELDYTGTPLVQNFAPYKGFYEYFDGNDVPDDVVDLSARDIYFWPSSSAVYNIYPAFPDGNDDGVVNWMDLAIFSAAYGSSAGNPNYNPTADYNGDGKVNNSDVGPMSSRYGVSL